MKWFNVVVVIIGLTLGIMTVSSRNIDSSTITCEDQLKQIYLQTVLTCAPRKFHIEDILQTIRIYRRHTRNGTVYFPKPFSGAISEYCSTLKSAVTCSMKNSTIVSSTCPDNNKIQAFLNRMRFIGRIADFCSETIIYEIGGDAGFHCFNLNTLDQCMYGKRSNQDVGMPLEDRNICKTVHRLHACIDDLFDECQNDGTFKRYASQALSGLIQDFSCEFDEEFIY